MNTHTPITDTKFDTFISQVHVYFISNFPSSIIGSFTPIKPLSVSNVCNFIFSFAVFNVTS